MAVVQRQIWEMFSSLNILQAFDKIWHEVLLFKMKSYKIGGSFVRLLTYLKLLNRASWRLVLNERNSSCQNVTAAVPQGFVLGPFLFLIYINNLPYETISSCKIISDETSPFS